MVSPTGFHCANLAICAREPSVAAVAATLAALPAFTIVDLAYGTGSMLRALHHICRSKTGNLSTTTWRFGGVPPTRPISCARS